ncbi:BamA/TamA family outer membrane protein [Sphingobacterium bovistauri]|uniref:BamA/TamA family outer membrane protein n=1 Tax=Sphingobacterium bovistauri TaxID=2781959 RepID=A0ABS7Z4F4_9SPHI|nr:BamA/TamA family outer membrane protein [Sphingobacterium bovistauri]MCA5004893.1 BamA/TamA family outer membrane protein [Sphingobacterium bovistauri]
MKAHIQFLFCIIVCILLGLNNVKAQLVDQNIPLDTVQQPKTLKQNQIQQIDSLYDVVDAFKAINPIKNKNKENFSKKRSPISYLPNINYNPSIGFQIGVKAVGGVYFGDKKNTSMSVFATALNYTTKGIAVGYLFHDTYTKENNWNLKGSLHIAKMVGLDYGIGLGMPLENLTDEEQILNNPERIRYVNNYTVYGFSERIYKQLTDNLFLGAGIYIDLKRNIKTLGDFENTPLDVYSDRKGYNPHMNNNNGLMLNVQYMTRDNPNNAYKGIYSDIVLRANQTWLGSSQEGFQLLTDFRKYWQLSNYRPNHVLAFWHYGSFNVGGDQGYLDLPGTGKDPYARSGRGYTNGYFRGKSFAYTEIEYRFPILRNQFLSGVVFANMQTIDDEIGSKLFRQWQPAGGAGLRILFNKLTRTNLCIDYAFGKFGQKGLFLGLNEAF